MEKLTYRQAYDKIIEAYFKNEIEPLDAEFCFCGTLCNNTTSWCGPLGNFSSHGYAGYDFDKMERALFDGIKSTAKVKCISDIPREDPKYEAALFVGMSAALDVLKEIHRQRGENVDEIIPVFTKRKLQNSKYTNHEAQTQT